MKFIATITADLVTSPMGTRSRLRDDLGGKPVLRRTVERVLRARRLDAVHVLSPADQAGELRALLDGLAVQLETHTAGPAPYAALVRAGRWWGLDGWRGGIGGMCAFDEDLHVALAAALAERVGADAIVSIPAAAAVVDPVIIDAMIDHYESTDDAVRVVIVQAPPGLGAVVLAGSLLSELAPTGQPPGVLLTYDPNHPKPDVTGKENCYRPAAEVIEARGRLVCDTRRSFDRVQDLLEAGGETWDAAKIATWLSARGVCQADPAPEEIEIELTTQDPLAARTVLRPRGEQVGTRGPMALDTVHAIAEAIRDYDDVRIVMGGFGEPCCHPEFGEICRILKASAAASVAVRTNAFLDEPGVADALFETPVDVIEVTLDAARSQTYRNVYGVDAFEAVTARLEEWLSRRASGDKVLPLIVPSLVKAGETIDDMEAFFDTWQRRLGMSAITGYSHCAGQRPRRAVIHMAPSARDRCLRVFSRAVVLADGRVTTCDQDFAARQAVGRIGDATFLELWQSKLFDPIRENRYNEMPLCPACDEWHRP